MAKGGAPRKEIDWLSLDGYCGLDATLEYCAEAQVKKWGQETNYKTITAARKLISRRIKERFGCSYATYKDQRKDPRRISLRQKMWAAAENGNVALMIWLSKNECGMRDQPEQNQVPQTTSISFNIGHADDTEPKPS